MGNPEIFARYVGGGNFLNGVPTRNLTEAEWDALDEETQLACRKQHLYEVAGVTPALAMNDVRDESHEENA